MRWSFGHLLIHCITTVGVSPTVYRTAVKNTHEPVDCARWQRHSTWLTPNTKNKCQDRWETVVRFPFAREAAWWEERSSDWERVYCSKYVPWEKTCQECCVQTDSTVRWSRSREEHGVNVQAAFKKKRTLRWVCSSTFWPLPITFW